MALLQFPDISLFIFAILKMIVKLSRNTVCCLCLIPSETNLSVQSWLSNLGFSKQKQNEKNGTSIKTVWQYLDGITWLVPSLLVLMMNHYVYPGF